MWLSKKAMGSGAGAECAGRAGRAQNASKVVVAQRALTIWWDKPEGAKVLAGRITGRRTRVACGDLEIRGDIDE
jgi:hypothetical protein